MTIPIRIAARLDIKGDHVIKGVHLEGLRRIGRPSEIARSYYNQGIDELIYIDAVASLYGRNNLLSVISDAATDIFVPITVGGGIRSLEDAKSALRAGADKVAINTAAVQDPTILNQIAETFGSQCLVLSVEAKSRGIMEWEALTDNGREKTGRDVFTWAAEAESRGVGEILVTSVDQEGTRNGFDISLLDHMRQCVQIPIVASGGAGCEDDVIKLANQNYCDAIACASIFHYGITTVTQIKNNLSLSGIEVRT